ncbi:MAG: septum formation initiator family protein [Thalassolituus sp.]|nr:septum formation initiator family protein [Thalassolituus oleivorans]AHK14911.1 cell division protein FtsB [Thalassolituus oleivorans R6-15]MDF1642238.1 septum formation initiator family protein [Thalassolituus oleivorans]
MQRNFCFDHSKTHYQDEQWAMAISLKYIWTTVAVLLLLLLQYRLWFDDSGVVASNELRQLTDTMESNNLHQQQVNRDLMAEVHDLKTGTALLEETAREDLGLIRDGETFILFVDPK